MTTTLIAIADSDLHQQLLIVDEIPFDVFTFTEQQFTRTLERYNRCFVPMAANGKILIERDDIASKLKDKANYYFKNKNPLVDENKIIQELRGNTYGLLRSLHLSYNESMKFNLCLYELYDVLYNAICLQNNKWPLNKKNLFNDLRVSFPHLHSKVEYIEKLKTNEDKYLAVLSFA